MTISIIETLPQCPLSDCHKRNLLWPNCVLTEVKRRGRLGVIVCIEMREGTAPRGHKDFIKKRRNTRLEGAAGKNRGALSQRHFHSTKTSTSDADAAGAPIVPKSDRRRRCHFALFAQSGPVQGYGGANEALQSLLVDLDTLMKVDGAPYIPVETGIEEA
jgi:hypothetical protein